MGEVTAKLKFKPTVVIPSTHSWVPAGSEQDCRVSGLSLPLRQRGMCWGHPIVEGPPILNSLAPL